jgi:hypothetical protein
MGATGSGRRPGSRAPCRLRSRAPPATRRGAPPGLCQWSTPRVPDHQGYVQGLRYTARPCGADLPGGLVGGLAAAGVRVQGLHAQGARRPRTAAPAAAAIVGGRSDRKPRDACTVCDLSALPPYADALSRCTCACTSVPVPQTVCRAGQQGRSLRPGRAHPVERASSLPCRSSPQARAKCFHGTSPLCPSAARTGGCARPSLDALAA